MKNAIVVKEINLLDGFMELKKVPVGTKILAAENSNNNEGSYLIKIKSRFSVVGKEHFDFQ